MAEHTCRCGRCGACTDYYLASNVPLLTRARRSLRDSVMMREVMALLIAEVGRDT